MSFYHDVWIYALIIMHIRSDGELMIFHLSIKKPTQPAGIIRVPHNISPNIKGAQCSVTHIVVVNLMREE